MPIRQLSVFLENRKGRLSAVAKTLSDAGVNIRGLAVADTADFGIVRLIVENLPGAEAALKADGVVFQTNEVTAVQVDHNPGGLARVLQLLNDSNVNVEYMYVLAEPKNENPVMILSFSEPAVAREILQKGGCALLDEAALGL